MSDERLQRFLQDREQLVQRLAAGESRTELIHELSVKLFKIHEEQGDDAAEADHLMDLLDCFYGWCAPNWRL